MAEDIPTGQFDERVAFNHVMYWLREERGYTLDKFGSDKDIKNVKAFANSEYGHETHFNGQFDTYFHRAWVLGLDTPGGRQALAKFVSTAASMLAAAVQEYGRLPKPGVPSGEIVE